LKIDRIILFYIFHLPNINSQQAKTDQEDSVLIKISTYQFIIIINIEIVIKTEPRRSTTKILSYPIQNQ